jgi:hypothetical protein
MLTHGGPHLGQLLEHEHTIDRTLGSILRRPRPTVRRDYLPAAELRHHRRVALAIIIDAKFIEGAWITLIVIPCVIFLPEMFKCLIMILFAARTGAFGFQLRKTVARCLS